MKLTEKLAAIDVLTKQCHAASSHEVCCELLVQGMQSLTDSDRVTLFVYHPQTNMLVSQIAQGLSTKIYLELGEGIVGQSALQKAVMQSSDVDDAHAFNPDIDMTSGYITYNTLTVPILDRQNNLLGVYQLLNKNVGNYDATDIKVATILANLTARYLV